MVDLRARPRDRQEKLRQLVDDIRSRNFPYEPRPKHKTDWARYDDAQIHLTHDTLRLLVRIIDRVPEPPLRPGPGRHNTDTAKDRAKVVVMAQHLGLSNRRASGFALLFREKLGLVTTPHYKAVERAYEDPRVISVLEAAFTETARIGARHAKAFSLDGSGLPTSIKQNWERDKRAQRFDRFDGAITMLALPSMVITAHQGLAIGFANESPFMAGLVQRTAALAGPLAGRAVCADAAFVSRDNCDVVATFGGRPRIFPKRTLSWKSLGSAAWAPMLLSLLRDPQAWLWEYHQRSLSETGWSTFKRMFPGPLRTLLAVRRPSERLARFLTYNLVRLAGCHRQHLIALPPTLN